MTKAERLAKRFNLATMHPDKIAPNYNVAPGHIMPVITEDETGRKLQTMKWGIPRFIGPGKTKAVINTRADKAFSSWKKLVMRQRALIPANGFYEWDRIIGNGKEQKQPYYIHPRDIDMFAFAGVWDTWKDVEGLEWHTYSIITTEANKEVAAIHNRMPVILHQEDEASWLAPAHNDDQNALAALLHPYEDGGLEMFTVSSDVNVTRNNDEKLIYPLNSQ